MFTFTPYSTSETPPAVPETFVHEFAAVDPPPHASDSVVWSHSPPESISLSPTHSKSGTLPSGM